MYLVDTNIWLERLLGQARSDEVGSFLDQVPTDDLLMTDFTLHSIGIILSRLGQRAVLPRFVEDLFVQGHVTLASVRPTAMIRLVAIMDQFNLDLDDAYQYTAAEEYGATIVSFDQDFDRTVLGRHAPIDVLEQ